MLRTRKVSSLWWLAGPLLFALACSHDSPRDNPLDLTLTPPVELQVALDDTAGTATLTWTRHEGEAEFGEYWVLRNEVESTRVETLDVVSAVDQTAYVDTSLAYDTPHVYRVSTVNAAGFEVVSEERRTRVLRLPAVDLVVTVDSRTATATLKWTFYQGPRFADYRLLRWQGRDVVELTRIADNATIVHVDSHLVGNVDYRYQVVVGTRDGVEVPGPQAAAVIHPLVDSWPLDISPAGAVGDRVRLYRESGNRIVALVGGVARVRLLVYDTRGRLLDEQRLVNLPFDGRGKARYFATALHDGQRLLSVSGRAEDTAFGLLAFDEMGRALRTEWVLFDEPYLQELPEEQRQIEGRVALDVRTSGAVDNVVVISDGAVAIEDGFEANTPVAGDGELVNGWRVSARGTWALGSTSRFAGGLALSCSGDTWRRGTRCTGSWWIFRLFSPACSPAFPWACPWRSLQNGSAPASPPP